MTEPQQPAGPQAALIHVDGRIEFMPFDPTALGRREELQMMYRVLECNMIEAVTLDPITALMPDLEFATLWIDETGKYEPKPMNEVATWLCQRMYQSISDDDWIAGLAFVTGGADEHGNTQPLKPATVEFLAAIASVTNERTPR